MEWLDAIIAWDQAATLWMNSHFSPVADSFWVFMSGIKIWIPMYVAVAAILIWRLGWKKGLVAIACILAAFFLSERVNNLIKYLVERVRPCNDEGMIAAGLHILEQGGGWSFPSGHANNSFTFAIASALCMRIEMLGFGKKDTSASLRKKRIPAGVRRWPYIYGIFIVTWAVLVGISRIMVARHFVLDVVVGSLIGILLGIAFGQLAILVCKKVNW